ncbi:MAG: helix-turn-helix domain-containing protein [Oscillospiraceae bacterium]|nr:helix-turn-helix domain-containing protein [Oscillospiraceae bacterium]
MAEILGITERSYQRYEAERNPNNETLIKLADFFDVSTDYLLGRSDNPRRQ